MRQERKNKMLQLKQVNGGSNTNRTGDIDPVRGWNNGCPPIINPILTALPRKAPNTIAITTLT
jgi:hypothetical protein